MATYNIDNPPTQLTMQDFLASASRYEGLAKSSRFIVRIQPSGVNSRLTKYKNIMPQLQYLCESAELPGRGFLNIDLSYHGPKFKVPYLSEYQETSMTFLCRNRSFEREFFDDWMEIINPTSSFDFEYKDSYKAEIHMFQMGDTPGRVKDEAGNTVRSKTEPVANYAWTLHDAFPILINPQPVTWADDNFQRLTVAFTFSKWTRKYADKEPGTYSLVSAPAVVVGVNEPSNPV
jgi:hypothetical protein